MRPEPKPGASEEAEPTWEKGRVRRKTVVFRLLLVLLSICLSAAGAEIVLRVFFSGRFFLYHDEKSLLYRYDSVLGWFPIPGARERFVASREFSVINNSQGFRAPEFVPSQRPGIVFLGDSFVWGYDVEAEERFTEKLQARHPEWSVYNLGVSGYGTDQEYLLLQRYFALYQPRVVFLLYCVETDHEDNSSNMRYGGYYKPYCTIVDNRLQLQGVPVPRSERAVLAEHKLMARSLVCQALVRIYFKMTGPPRLKNPDPTGALIRDLQNYVHSKAAQLVIGLTRSNPRLEEFLRYFSIPYVDLTTSLRYPGYGGHWTPEGHSLVCGKIEAFLVAGKYVEKGGQKAPSSKNQDPGKLQAPSSAAIPSGP